MRSRRQLFCLHREESRCSADREDGTRAVPRRVRRIVSGSGFQCRHDGEQRHGFDKVSTSQGIHIDLRCFMGSLIEFHTSEEKLMRTKLVQLLTAGLALIVLSAGLARVTFAAM